MQSVSWQLIFHPLIISFGLFRHGISAKFSRSGVLIHRLASDTCLTPIVETCQVSTAFDCCLWLCFLTEAIVMAYRLMHQHRSVLTESHTTQHVDYFYRERGANDGHTSCFFNRLGLTVVVLETVFVFYPASI